MHDHKNGGNDPPIRTGATHQKFILVDGKGFNDIKSALDFELKIDELIKFLAQGQKDYKNVYFINRNIDKYDFLCFELRNCGFDIIPCSSDDEIGRQIVSHLKSIKPMPGRTDVIMVGGTTDHYSETVKQLADNYSKKILLYSTISVLHNSLNAENIIFFDLNNYRKKIKNIKTDEEMTIIEAEETIKLKPAEQKCIILLDWPNFKRNQKIEKEFDLKIFKDTLIGPGRICVEARCYMPAPLWERNKATKQKYEEAGFTIHNGPFELNGKIDVDDTIITDIGSIAKTNQANVFILVSCDHAFIDNLFNAKTEQKIKIEILGSEINFCQHYHNVSCFQVIDPGDFQKKLVKATQKSKNVTVIEREPEPVNIEKSIHEKGEKNMTDIQYQPVKPDNVEPKDMLELVSKMAISGTLDQIEATINNGDRQITFKVTSKELKT